MKSTAVLALIALCARSSFASNSGSPVEKVVHLLTDLKDKIKADGHSELLAYEKFECWCDNMKKTKTAAIEQAKKDLKRLASEIKSLEGKIKKAKEDIKEAKKDQKDNKDAQDKATKTRNTEHLSFAATRAEMGQAAQALQQGLKMLKMAPQFLQTQTALSTEAAEAVRAAITAIPDATLGSLPAGKISQIQKVGTAVSEGKYDPSYGSLVTILEEMESTISSDLAKETKSENKAQSDYEDLMNTKIKEYKALQAKIDKTEALKAQAESDLAAAQQNFDDTKKQKENDEQVLKNTIKACDDKKKEWDIRTKTRDEELAGVEKAIEILTSDAARELFAKSINAGARVSFLQVDAAPAMPEGQQKAFKLLKTFATRSQSIALAKIAAQVRLAQGGHFDAVMGAITKVIGVLKKEQEDDNNKKTQCNEEYQKVAQKSNKLNWKIEKNVAKIEDLETTIANKEADKAATIQSIKDTVKQIKDMKKERNDANQAFAAAKKDDQDAVKLLNQAKDALLQFYKKHSLSDALTEFIQGGEPKFDRGDAAPDLKFSGKGSRAGQTKGINLILATIIEGLEDEIRVQTQVEKDAVAAFKKALKAAEDLQKTLETKRDNLKKEIADRTKDKDDEDKKKKGNEKDLKDEQDYKAKIKPDCDFMLKNWQDRYNKRKAEMEGLTTAMDFLAGAMKGAALVETNRHVHL